MKQLIFHQLTAGFPDISKDVLIRMAGKLAKNVTEEKQATTAVAGVSYQQIMDSEADRRATEAARTAIANYEKKHGLKDGRKVDGNAPENGTISDQIPIPGNHFGERAGEKPINELLQPIIREMEKLRQQQIITERRRILASVLKDLTEVMNDSVYEKFEMMTFEDDDEFNAWIDAFSRWGVANL